MSKINQNTINALVTWFQEVRESYFFRENRNPYRVWVSEVILQQTRIQAALAPLRRFFQYFPDINSLATAKEEKVVFEFRGLGYYSRARNLRKGAIYLNKNHDGKLPKLYDDLLLVPSIGPYTAAAIASICFGKNYPVCDGNVKRVLIRMQKWPITTQDKKAEFNSLKLLKKLYKNLSVPAGDANEAIMELGQKICIRTNPNCITCPINNDCLAFQDNVVQEYPTKKIKSKKIDVIWHLFLIHRDQKILLQEWHNFYFLKKQISFPSILEFKEEKKQIISWEKTEKTNIENILKKYSSKRLPTIKHAITKHRITIQPYIITDEKWEKNSSKNPYKWIKKNNVQKYLVSSALTKIWKRVYGENT